MANTEHLWILKQGVKSWNRWREQNPGQIPDLREASLEGIDLRGAYLRKTDLSGANLCGARFDTAAPDAPRADLSNAKLVGARIHAATFRMADLHGADLRRADFYRSQLSIANLNHADLAGASLRRTILIATDFHHAGFDNTDLAEALVGHTRFTAVDLSRVKGLVTLRYDYPSTIDLDSIYTSKGHIPEAFLRGIGVPENFIVYMRSLVTNPIEFYSCFISHSNKDQDFAQRLHRELQGEGVRCWFAPEDLKIGDEFRTTIEDSIRVYDKLLIILSEASIDSEWVKTEVEAALEREVREKQSILFPIRVDDAAMQTSCAWAAKIRREKHIGDFRNWKDYGSFKKAFNRLLRDLGAGG